MMKPASPAGNGNNSVLRPKADKLHSHWGVFVRLVRSLVIVQFFLTIAVDAAETLPRNQPPPSANNPWFPPELPKYESELARRSGAKAEGNAKASIDPRKVYGLAELIDIAQRNNPETRVAWERARQAAAAVGRN